MATSKPGAIPRLTQSEYLPGELLHEIFKYLPVKDLLRFKCVCKSWQRLICSPDFVRLHLSVSRKQRPMFLVPPAGITYRNSDEIKTIELPFDFRNRDSVSILGACDGLVAILRSDKGQVFMSNPSTREASTLRIPRLRNPVSFSWFGLNPISDEYVLFVGESAEPNDSSPPKMRAFRRHHSKMMFLPLCDDSQPRKYIRFFPTIGTLAQKSLHWATKCENSSEQIILTYDFRAGRMAELMLPTALKQGFSTIGCLNDCLIAACTWALRSVVEIWTMKEHGVQESWCRYARLSTDTMAKPMICSWTLMECLGFWGDGKKHILMSERGVNFMKYDLSSGRFELVLRAEGVHRGCRVKMIDSFVSPQDFGWECDEQAIYFY